MSEYHNTKAEDRVPLGQKLAVGAGGFPIQNGGLIVQYMAQPIFQIFLGLNPALFGLAMTIPRIWDAFTDPVMGRISDRTQSRYGRRRPYVFVGALAVALTFLTIWMVPQSMGDTGTFLWLTIGSVLFFTAFTVFSVPFNALVYEQTPDYHERTRLMFYLALFYNIGNLCVNWYVPATNWSGFENPLVGARWIALGLALIVFFVGLVTTFTSTVSHSIIACVVIGSIVLAPAIVVGYAVKAAERDDLEHGREIG